MIHAYKFCFSKDLISSSRAGIALCHYLVYSCSNDQLSAELTVGYNKSCLWRDRLITEGHVQVKSNFLILSLSGCVSDVYLYPSFNL